MNAQLNQTCIHVDSVVRNGLRVCLDCEQSIDPLYDPSEAIDAILREHEQRGRERLNAG